MADAVHIGVPIEHLRPTQMTVGFREVAVRRAAWRDADADERSKLLRRHVLPAVIGPKSLPYIVDHHHFARALVEEDAGPVAVFIVADLGHLPTKRFWTYLDNSAWCHAYDAKGRRCDLADIPKHLTKLADDPYRSLAGAVIRAGGCAKSKSPFAEFLWADYLRHRVKTGMVEHEWDKAVARAVKLSRDDEAKSLPGWCGPGHSF